MQRKIIKKFYSKDDKCFHIVQQNKKFEQHDYKIKTLSKFYRRLNNDLTDVDMLDYDIGKSELSKYDFSKAKISSKAMQLMGAYDATLFQNLNEKAYRRLEYKTNGNLTTNKERNLVCINSDETYDDVVVCYLSDLHIVHKVIKAFPSSVNEYEIIKYFNQIVNSLCDSIPKVEIFESQTIILFIGDISSDFSLFQKFFEIFRQKCTLETFFIMGNHELWDEDLNLKYKSIEDIICKYRSFLQNLQPPIILLENELYLPNEDRIYTEHDLLTISEDQLRRIFLENGYAVFGGLGYAGNNEEFNCTNNIYRTAPITRRQEIERSERVQILHNKLTKVASDKKLFFVTHMPIEDWGNINYNKCWQYLYGHTHQNYYLETENIHIYADNQIGYNNTSYGFKYLTASKDYDIFEDMSNGIYEITRQDYIKFYLGLGIRIQFRREFEQLYMVKRAGLYAFFVKTKGSNVLKILDGGSWKSVKQNNVQYYYEHILEYSQAINALLKKYNQYLESIAKEVKKFGGTGNIHGCIVDINYSCHIFVNPFDRSITPYKAYTTKEKFVYNSVRNLLQENDLILYHKYENLCSSDMSNNMLIVQRSNQISDKIYIEDTEIYSVSWYISKLNNSCGSIITWWDDSILSKNQHCNQSVIMNKTTK